MKSVVYRGVLSCGKPVAAPQPPLPVLAAALPAVPVPTEAPPGTALPAETHYSVVAQSVDEVRSPDSSPSLSMWPYLLASAQTQRLNSISIYAEPGTTRDAVRYLYLNSTALELWTALRGPVTVLARRRRPPQSATLCFGMPFSQ